MPDVLSDPPSSRPTPDSLMLRQRRASGRRPFEAVIEVYEPNPGTGVTINASDGGLRVAVDCELRPEDVVLLAVREAGRPERLECARVAWSLELRDGWIAGLQLIGLH